jgi:hypothetical protein
MSEHPSTPNGPDNNGSVTLAQTNTRRH